MENVGKVAIMHRAVYGGKTSRRDFRNHLRSCMEFFNFTSCPADPDVWMRPAIKSDKTPVLSLLDLLLSGDPQLFLTLLVSFLKIACLHVSFTAYENFYKLSKMHCLLVLTFHFPIFRMSECRNPTIKHIFHLYIDFIIHKYICDRSLSGDPFHIVNPF